MANKRTYTNEELAYIKRYYPTCNTQLIADELGWTERKVKRVAIYHGINKKVHHSKKAPKALSKPFETLTLKDFEPENMQRVGKILGSAGVSFLNTRPEVYEYYQGRQPVFDALAPKSPNLFQRIIGFLLRGDW